MNNLELKNFVEQNPKLVTNRQSTSYPELSVLRYSKQVFYKNLWNDYLEYCRGTVIDKDYNLISAPPLKIYNYGVEERAPVIDPETKVTAYRKVNGFLACLTWYNGDVLVSTTGSLDSDFVGYAKEMMLTHMKWEDWQIALNTNSDYTFFFECVHPEDPHVIPEKNGMYLLGFREKSWDSGIKLYGAEMADMLKDFAQDTFNCFYAEAYHMTMAELQSNVKSVKHEGYVVYAEDGKCAKIKSPWYLMNKWVARNPNTDKLVDLKNDIKKNIEEEYYNLIDHIRANIEEYTALEEQGRLEWIREFFER
jgi:hypothetical protein